MILIILLISAATLSFIWRWQRTSTFKRLGIPGPEPNILFGNFIELYWKGPLKCHEEWTKKYGRVVGYYLGMTPALLVTDPELLKNIYIKDFSKFMDREPIIPLTVYNPHSKLGQGIATLPGEPWKNVRNVVTPTFTLSKIKQMTVVMVSAIDLLLEKLNIYADKYKNGFDIHDAYIRLSLDIVCRTSFGLKEDIQTNPKSKFFSTVKILGICQYRDPAVFIGLSFPMVRTFAVYFHYLVLFLLFKGRNPLQALHNRIIEILQYRKQNSKVKHCDLLQIMDDHNKSGEMEDFSFSELEAGTDTKVSTTNGQVKHNKKIRKMTDEEVICTAIAVMIGGFETTSTTMAYTTYLLGKHQNIQEKIYHEVKEFFENTNKNDYTEICKLPYLDKVLSESLRIHPPSFLFSSRFASEDVQYGNIKIPKGMLIRAPTYTIHNDPEFWENPSEFNPERFSEKSNVDGVTYFPFGVGPRNCLGIRYAQLEMKLVLAHVIHNYRINLSDKCKDSLKETLMARTLYPTNGVHIKLEKRNKE